MATFSTSIIPFSNADLNRPGGGAEQWHSQNTVNIPVEGTNTQRLDVYYRSPLTWAKIETSKNNYNWTPVINILNAAIQKRQKVRLGFMSVYHDSEDGVINYDGGNSSYPLYLHQEMQAESVKDWRSPMSGGWVPNYNSPKYLDAQRRFNTSLNNLLETGSFNGVRYKDIINSIDVRGYGNYGEWHNGGIVNQVSEIPSGAHATTATLKAIIDAHTQILQDYQLNIVMTAFDANWLQHTRTSAEVGYYALTTSNRHGRLGWLRDNWGAGDSTGDTYIDDLLIDNNRTWNGVPLNSLIMEVWKYAPVTGEPMNSTSNSFAEFEAQVRKYHAASFGNGNITFSPNSTTKTNFRAASKAAGYRLQIEGGSFTNTNNSVTATLNWRNAGIAPTYDNWNVQLLLKNSSGAIVAQSVSQFKPRLFLPSTSFTAVTDTFSFNIPTGQYTLAVRVVDPTGYRNPLPLFINGQQTDGSYNLALLTVSGTVPNQSPVANAGTDKVITLPTNSVTLTGTATDGDGTISSTVWSRVSGSGTITTPNSVTTTVTGLTAGTSVFRFTVTDDDGATSFDEVSVLVNSAPNQGPNANAGADKVITAPASSVTLTGTASDPDGTVTTLWTKFSGSGNIVSPTSLTTQITGLTVGQSIFRLIATDDDGAQSIDSVTVTVNPVTNTPPVVNAGIDRTTTSANVTISGTVSDNGTFTSVWTRISGAGVISSPNNLITDINGLAIGANVFRLTATDSQGLTSFDDVTITLEAPAPVTIKSITQTILRTDGTTQTQVIS